VISQRDIKVLESEFFVSKIQDVSNRKRIITNNYIDSNTFNLKKIKIYQDMI